MATDTNLAAAERDQLARRLQDADLSAAAIEPLSETQSGLTIPDAYAVQTAGRQLRLNDNPEPVVGHKIGLTSQAMQEMVGVDQPDYGYLLASMIVDDGGELERARLIAPRVEGEIAFVLGEPLAGPDVTVADVLNATRHVAAAIEVIDSRIADWRITITDTIADNASSARAVIGPLVELADLDLATLQMQMTVDGDQVDGRGDAVLGHPAEAVAWLAKSLHQFGEPLEAGEIILSGALARALPVVAGSRANVTIAELGSVSVSFR